MPQFSPNQAKLAKALIQGARTANELRDELGIPLNEVEKDLGVLIKLKVVEKLGGYPTKYQAIEGVRKRFMTDKPTEQGIFRAHIIIEGQSKEKASLEYAIKDLITKLNTDKLIAVSNLTNADITQDGDIFTTLFEADVSTKNLEDMMYLVLTYGPSSIELDPFKEYPIKTHEAQALLMDVASVLQAYASTLVQKDLQLQDYRKKSPELFIK